MTSRTADSEMREHNLNQGRWRLQSKMLPLIGVAVIVVTGMLYSFFWNTIYHHDPSWTTPSDLWNTFRASQYVSWGGEGQIYNNPAHFQTFPGIAVLLAPIARLSDALNLSASFPLTLARPTAWLLLGPAELMMGSVALFALDRLALRLGIDGLRRMGLFAIEAVLIWPSVALWGHPEDPLALALAVYALLASLDGRWIRAAMLAGLALAVQPFVILLVPIIVARAPMKEWPAMGGVVAIPSGLLLIAPLAQEWGPTMGVLRRQPNFPIGNHPTPWMSLAPVIRVGHTSVTRLAEYVTLPDGHRRLIEVSSRVHSAPIVAAGPGRLIAVAIACLIGLLIWMKRPSTLRVIWLAALVLEIRCAFEPVMVPYYLLPGLTLVSVVAVGATKSRPRRVIALFAVASCTLLSYQHLRPWAYYLAVMASLSLAMITSWPRSNDADAHVVVATVHPRWFIKAHANE